MGNYIPTFNIINGQNVIRKKKARDFVLHFEKFTYCLFRNHIYIIMYK